jgi:hypothetical protein
MIEITSLMRDASHSLKPDFASIVIFVKQCSTTLGAGVIE